MEQHNEQPVVSHVGCLMLAGGGGTRLRPLTVRKPKPGIEFGGKWIIADLVMWALYFSGLRGVGVLTQSEGYTLQQHINRAWPIWPGGRSGYFSVLPPRGVDGHDKYLGTADAVYQNLHFMAGKKHVLVVAGDHLYMANFNNLIQFHEEREADVTVMATTAPAEEAKEYGVMSVDHQHCIESFEEKPEEPKEIPGQPGYAYCSMGVYIFEMKALEKYLKEDAEDPKSKHDFGKDIIPKMIEDGRRVAAFPFSENPAPGQKVAYWRDLGTLRTYWEEHMNLCGNDPVLNLFTANWPIGTIGDGTAPYKQGGANTDHPDRPRDSITSNNSIAGGNVHTGIEARYNSFGRNVQMYYSLAEQNVFLGQLIIEPDCVIKKAIIDNPRNLDIQPNVRHIIPAGTKIGIDLEHDRDRGFTVTDEGIVVVPHTWFIETGNITEVQ